MEHLIQGITYSDELIDEIIESDSAGWTVTEIAIDLGLSRQSVIDVFLHFERYEPTDSSLKT